MFSKLYRVPSWSWVGGMLLQKVEASTLLQSNRSFFRVRTRMNFLRKKQIYFHNTQHHSRARGRTPPACDMNKIIMNAGKLFVNIGVAKGRNSIFSSSCPTCWLSSRIWASASLPPFRAKGGFFRTILLGVMFIRAGFCMFLGPVGEVLCGTLWSKKKQHQNFSLCPLIKGPTHHCWARPNESLRHNEWAYMHS